MIKSKKNTTEGKVHNKINVQENVSPTDSKFKESRQKEDDDDNGWGTLIMEWKRNSLIKEHQHWKKNWRDIFQLNKLNKINDIGTKSVDIKSVQSKLQLNNFILSGSTNDRRIQQLAHKMNRWYDKIANRLANADNSEYYIHVFGSEYLISDMHRMREDVRKLKGRTYI